MVLKARGDPRDSRFFPLLSSSSVGVLDFENSLATASAMGYQTPSFAALSRSEKVKQTLLGIALMVVAGLSFGSMAALIKVSAQAVGAFEVILVRSVVSFSILAVARHLLPQKHPAVDRPALIARAVLGFLGLLFFVLAINLIELGLASALNQSSPIFVAIFAFLFLKERPPHLVPLLIFSAFLGVVFIVSPDLRSVDIRALLGLASGFFAGAAYAMVRKLRHTDAPSTIVMWFTGLSILFSAPVVVVQGWVMPSSWTWVALIGVGVCALMGQLAMTWSYRLAPAYAVSPFIYTTTLSSLAMGWLFWDEWPKATALGGGAMLVGSALLIGVLSARRAVATQ